MGRCKYHDTDYDCCARYSTFGGAYQHLVPCHKCDLFEPITNYDRIRSMSKEELADFICDIYASNEHASIRVAGKWMLPEDIEDWLTSEVEDEHIR